MQISQIYRESYILYFDGNILEIKKEKLSINNNILPFNREHQRISTQASSQKQKETSLQRSRFIKYQKNHQVKMENGPQNKNTPSSLKNDKEAIAHIVLSICHEILMEN